MLFNSKSLLVSITLATTLITIGNATPVHRRRLSPRDLEEIAEWLYQRDLAYEPEYDQLLARVTTSDNFAPHGSYSKDSAIQFLKNTPEHKLVGGGMRGSTNGGDTKKVTLHTADAKGRSQEKRPADGFRIDAEGKKGKDSKGHDLHEVSVQLNKGGGDNKHPKTTIGGYLTDGSKQNPKRVKNALIHSVMHPEKDSTGKNRLHTFSTKSGAAPTHLNGAKKTNEEARKKGPRRPKARNPNSKPVRKAEKKKMVAAANAGKKK